MAEIQDTFLEEMAKAANNETYDIPGFHGVTDDDTFTESTNITVLTGEIGSRTSVSSSRTSATVRYNTLRTGAGDVVDTANGDEIHGAALTAESSGTVFFIATDVPGVLHTTNFDLEFDYELEFVREE